MAKRYTSRQLLPMTGYVFIIIRITDHENKRSLQYGSSIVGNVERSYKQGINDALVNALYKHFSKHGRRIIKSDDANVTDFIKSYDLKDWWIEYYSENDKYTFKSKIIKNKRYLYVTYKNNYWKRFKTSYTSRSKVDNIINGLSNNEPRKTRTGRSKRYNRRSTNSQTNRTKTTKRRSSKEVKKLNKHKETIARHKKALKKKNKKRTTKTKTKTKDKKKPVTKTTRKKAKKT